MFYSQNRYVIIKRKAQKMIIKYTFKTWLLIQRTTVHQEWRKFSLFSDDVHTLTAQR